MSKSRSKSPSFDRFVGNMNKNKKINNNTNLNKKTENHVKENLEEDLLQCVKFDPEFQDDMGNFKQAKNEEKKALIDNVKEKILKRTKPKSIVRNYGIRDDNDPNAIKKLYDI